ncbi:MAG: VOC family protein [Bacteroidota bacterium]
MKIEKIDHICFVVKDLEHTKRIYEEDFGLIPACEYVAESEKIKVARYYIGEVAVEFMELTPPDGEVAKFMFAVGPQFDFLMSFSSRKLGNTTPHDGHR